MALWFYGSLALLLYGSVDVWFYGVLALWFFGSPTDDVWEQEAGALGSCA